MIGKIIGAVAGAQAAKATRGMDGTTGAVLGALAVPLARRMKVPALLALAAGGYAFKRLSDMGAQERSTSRMD
jgi:hypothetical protein